MARKSVGARRAAAKRCGEAADMCLAERQRRQGHRGTEHRMTEASLIQGARRSSLKTPWFVVGEDAVRLLRDGAEAFPAMIDAIAGAEREITLEMYWVGADKVGRRFREALVESATRGVRV